MRVLRFLFGALFGPLFGALVVWGAGAAQAAPVQVRDAVPDRPLGLSALKAATAVVAQVRPLGQLAPSAAAPRQDAISTGRSSFSSSLGLGRDVDLGNILWAANGTADTVSLVVLDEFGATPIYDTFVFSTGAGSEPTNVAVSGDGLRAWFTLRGRGQVLPLTLDKARGVVRFGRAITVGAEPYGIVLDTLGRNLYVANSTEGTVSVIDVATGNVIARPFLGDSTWPFALAVRGSLAVNGTASGEKIYVTQFFSKAGKSNNGGETDDSRVGKVAVLQDKKLLRTVDLKPFACFPFPAGSGQKIKGFANQLNSIFIKGNFGVVVSVGASPQRPVNFVANTQAFVHVFSTETDTEVAAINLNEAVEEEAPKGLFFNTPWGVAFPAQADEGFVLSAASNLAVKIKLDPATGVPSITGTATPQSTKGIRRVPVGKNPRSVIFSLDGNIAYVHDYISRDLTVVGRTTERAFARIPLSRLPTGDRERRIHHGEELYNTSLGDSTIDARAANTGRRMSTNGWGSCFSCHPFGWTDTVVWNFSDGPRKTLPTIGGALVSRKDPGDVRMLNWSAVRDELEDFEQNIRKVSSKFAADNQADDGKTGLMVGVPGSPTSPLGAQDIFDIVRGDGRPAKPNKGRSRDWDDLAEYMKNVRAPYSPVRLTDPRVVSGGRTFEELGCSECHAGNKWTVSRRPYDPAKLTQSQVDGIRADGNQVRSALRDVDSFFTEEEQAAVTNGVAGRAKGADGFNPPSLLGAWAFPPFFHNGRAKTLAEFLTFKRTTSARTHMEASEDRKKQARGRELARVPATLANLELFIRSIDDRTPVRNLQKRPPAPTAGVTPTAAALRRNAEVSDAGAAAAPAAPEPVAAAADPGVGVPAVDPDALEDAATARYKPSGVGERRYRAIAPGDGLQSVKGKDSLGEETAAGSTGGTGLRGIVFARAGGEFRPTGGEATITLRHVATGRTLTVRSGALAKSPEHNYAFGALAAGAYQVTVQQPGHGARQTRVPVVVEPDRTLELDVFLETSK